jgi:hypothetical protein
MRVGNSINLTKSMTMISPVRMSLGEPDSPMAPVNLTPRSLRIG